jgi:uncharacterized lipoprotein YmbA
MKACPSRARRAFALVAVVVAASALAGCGALSRPAPIKNTFLLAPAPLQPVAQPRQASLRVGAINVATPFRGKNFVYRESDLKFANDFYTEFLVPPAAMIGESTARLLSRAHVFARVAQPGAPSDADYVLDGFVEALYGDVREPAKPTVQLAITYYLSRADSASPFWSKEYRKSVAVPANSPEQYAIALSSALGDILGELARDLAAVELPK